MDPITPPPTEETPTTTPEAVTPEAPPSAGLHEMTKTERDSFLRDGKTPAREKKADPVSDDAADSSTAPGEGQKPAETAASEKKAASEPAAPAKEKKARNSEEGRVQELLTDRQRERDRADRAERRQQELETRLDALERGSKSDGKTASSTESQPLEPSWKKTAADKAFPKIDDFKSPDDWAAAVTDYTRAQIESGLSAKEQQTVESRQHQEVAERAISFGAAEIEADPTILDRIDPDLERLPAARALPAGQQPRPGHVVKDLILFSSRKPLSLMAFYSSPDGQAEWGQMMRMDGVDMQRTIIARELQLGTTSAQGEAAKGEKKPAAKTFTKAPNPPEKEGPKGAQATDGAEAAVKTGDYAELERQLDARGDGLSRRWGRRRAS